MLIRTVTNVGLLVGLALSVVTVGCTAPTNVVTTPSVGERGSSSDATGCIARCNEKATACQLESADYNCPNYVCVPSVPEGSLRCFEQTDCETIHASEGVCGFSYWKKTAPPADSPADSPADPSPPPSQLGKLGDSCKCAGPAGTLFCQSTSGPCESNLACLNSHRVCSLSCDDGNGTPKPSLCPTGFACFKTEVGNYCLDAGSH